LLDALRGSVSLTPMKRNFFAILISACLSVVIAGCVSTVDGRMKAGMPLVKDKKISRYERSVPQMMEAAKAVLERMGQIETYDIQGHTIYAKLNERNVWIKISEVESKDKPISQIVTQVRTRGGGGDIDLASEIDKQIALQLR
jgi:hypothetical protein